MPKHQDCIIDSGFPIGYDKKGNPLSTLFIGEDAFRASDFHFYPEILNQRNQDKLLIDWKSFCNEIRGDYVKEEKRNHRLR